jgi:hypothetical protein
MKRWTREAKLDHGEQIGSRPAKSSTLGESGLRFSHPTSVPAGRLTSARKPAQRIIKVKAKS